MQTIFPPDHLVLTHVNDDARQARHLRALVNRVDLTVSRPA
jgi:hypothetical protein